MKTCFFIIEEFINYNPYTKMLVPNDLQFDVMKFFQNFNPTQSLTKTFWNYDNCDWTEVLLYIMFKTKSLKTLVISSKSNIEFNIKQQLTGSLRDTVLTTGSYISNESLRKTKVDLLVSDSNFENSYTNFSLTNIKAKYTIFIKPSSCLKHSSPDPLRKININPQTLPTNYRFLDDAEVFDHVFTDYITVHDIQYNTKLMIINRTVYGCIYSAIKLSIVTRRNVYVCLGFDYVYKIIYNDLPDYYFELEETAEQLNWDFDELNECAQRIEFHELIDDMKNKDVFSIVGTQEVLERCYFDYDYLIITYLNKLNLIKPKNNGIVYYNTPGVLYDEEIDDEEPFEESYGSDIIIDLDDY